MRGICSAFSFLTVIKLNCEFDAHGALKFFPVVGLFIGSFLYGFSFLEDPFFQIFSIIWLIFITGGLHLDGLADTSDAIFSGKPIDEMLRIMKDSNIGTFGVLSLILVILVKFMTLSYIKIPIVLLFIPAYSRFLVLYLIKKLPYGRETGTAKVFFKRFKFTDFILGYVFFIVSFFVLPLYFACFFNFIFLFLGFLLYRYFKSKLGFVTGDVLGFSVEFSEAFLLLSVALYLSYV